MRAFSITPSLKKQGLRDTQPRRMVAEALRRHQKAASPRDIQQWITQRGQTISPVTVYRILAVFERLGLVHRDAENHFFLCSMPGHKGNHGFLRCTSCARIQEFCSEEVEFLESGIARKVGFQPFSFVNGILGICSLCSHD